MNDGEDSGEMVEKVDQIIKDMAKLEPIAPARLQNATKLAIKTK